MVNLLFRLVRLNVGAFVNVTQFVVVKSNFCCNTKFVEGMSQESARFVGEGVTFKDGAEVVR